MVPSSRGQVKCTTSVWLGNLTSTWYHILKSVPMFGPSARPTAVPLVRSASWNPHASPAGDSFHTAPVPVIQGGGSLLGSVLLLLYCQAPKVMRVGSATISASQTITLYPSASECVRASPAPVVLNTNFNTTGDSPPCCSIPNHSSSSACVSIIPTWGLSSGSTLTTHDKNRVSERCRARKSTC